MRYEIGSLNMRLETGVLNKRLIISICFILNQIDCFINEHEILKFFENENYVFSLDFDGVLLFHGWISLDPQMMNITVFRMYAMNDM